MLKRAPFPVKLLLIGLLPLVFLCIIAYELNQSRNEKIAVINATELRLDRTAAVIKLIDELQIERRLSFNYAINKTDNGATAVQRNKTDAAIASLVQLDPTVGADLKNFTFLNDLEAKRLLLNEQRLSPEGVMTFYSNAIFRLNTLAAISTTNIPFLSTVNSDVIGQRLLSEMVTYMGNLRASVYYSLYLKQSGTRAVDQLRSYYEVYNSFVSEFAIKGSPNAKRSFEALSKTGELKATLDYINAAIANGHLDTTVSPERWWVISAQGVDNLKELQRSLLAGVRKSVNDIHKNEVEGRNTTLAALILLIALVLAVCAIVTKSIANSINEIKNAAGLLAKGRTDVVVPVYGRDVIGSLGRSINNLVENNKELAGAADAIGRGDFTVAVNPRSDADLLGNAIAGMKTDLFRFKTQNEQKIWRQTGVNQMNDAVMGEKDLSAITRDVMDVLVRYLNAGVGLFYVSQHRESLYYAHGYAVGDESPRQEKIQFGQTLVGQAAVSKKMTLLSDVPENYIKIRSASGSATPRYLVILPLVFNNETEGVIELGFLMPLDDNALQLLNEVADNVAIALQAAKSKARLQELLEETQTQAEELQSQHSELENVNAELEAQAQKLQASEEELKVQQEELLQSNHELEERSRLLEEKNQLIVERNLEIQRKAEELEISTRYKSEFLANMSHELRTPLNSILLLSRLLAENGEQNLTDDQVEYAQVIQSSGNGLLSLIDEILDLSKIEAGKMDLEYEETSVEDIVSDLRRLFNPIANERGLVLNSYIEPKLEKDISTDRQRLEQVLKNLLSNALKFTSRGSISLSVTQGKDNFIDFSVKDTGIGIAKDKQETIFDAFQQADGSTKRKYGGTGLGLSISRELVKLLGGSITVNSEPGQGSEFKVSIPRARMETTMTLPEGNSPAEEADLPAEHSTATNSSMPEDTERFKYISPEIPGNLPDDRDEIKPGDRNLLIVEDDTAFAKALLDFARSRGYKGIVSVRGDEALPLAKKYSPLGILLDVQLPVKSGWEVMEELKGDPQTRHIPVHIMSSHMVKKESLKKGAVDFINKPVAFEKMQTIISKIEYVLKKKHKKVLIIEENPQHAKALAFFLSDYDVNTQISSNIPDSVTALTGKEADCVILDMGIPDLSAYHTLEKIKDTPGLEQLPIIVFTGKSLSKTEEEKLRQYADTIVVKTAHSYKRILDEVTLFLHLVEEQKQGEKSKRNDRLGTLNEVLKGKKILVTDDDVRNIFSLTKALEGYNMEVLSATDGKQALEVLEKHPEMGIVLMDIMMPQMDGYETMKRIRQQNKYRNLPIIAVTAKAMVGDREKCLRAGASDYISKPVDIDQLLSLLRVWLYDKSI